ncbi:MAG: hypothetical protein QOF51_3818 [Chloroflexota bacterium]|nr:hypothetical protein [Chloroflexota bacterium]
MCGRLALAEGYREIVRGVDVEALPAIRRRFNVAPTAPLPAFAMHRGRPTLDIYRWGIVPLWAKDGKPDLFNARDDKVATSSSYRGWLRQNRCIVPASHFFEWQKVGGAKIPHAIHRRDGRPLLLAGVWALGLDPQNAIDMPSVCLFTTRANGVMEPLHTRMPVILDPDRVDEWLDSDLQNLAALQLFLQPCPDEWLEAYPVSDAVNRAANEGPELLQPAATHAADGGYVTGTARNLELPIS